MLQKLYVQNYAIIDELEIDFSERLNIITGETGAGKSIIMGALGLILGERADSSVLVNKDKKSVVEGTFRAINKNAIRTFLEENELDSSDDVVIRREIGSNGKSRAFINDTPVNLSQLNELSSLLVDLHQQFDTLEIGESEFQREVIDAMAGNNNLLREYQTLYSNWQQLKNQLDTLKEKKSQFDKEADYNQFQFKELADVGFKENELENLESEIKLLTHSESIKAALDKVYYELQDSDTPLIQQIKVLTGQLSAVASYHPDLEDLIKRLQASQIELKDIADEVDRINDHIGYDPRKIEEMNERLSIGYKLQKKHGVKSTAELLQIQNELEQKLQEVMNIDSDILEAEKKAQDAYQQTEKVATVLSKARSKQVKPLEIQVNKLLVQVGMPNARIKVDIQPTKLNLNGAEVIEFLFDANTSPGDNDKKQFQPIRKVASGGELSRLMLCIKSLVAKSIDLPTLIFDEIDTGISGEAARQVGVIMKDLASSRQVICITHQPQIAGKADAHFFVYKEIVGDKVKTNIRQLNTEERIRTIAKMLSGEKPTAAALENAKEMVGN